MKGNSYRVITILQDIKDMDQIIERYKDFADIKQDNKDIQRKAEEYALLNESHKYSMKQIVKSLFWYVYSKQVPGFNGVLKIR